MNLIEFAGYAEAGSVLATVASIPMTILSANGWLRASRLKMPVCAVPDEVEGEGFADFFGRDMAKFMERADRGVERMEASLEVIDDSGRLNAEAARFAVWAAGLIALATALHVAAYVLPTIADWLSAPE